jgi:hypothetical protein
MLDQVARRGWPWTRDGLVRKRWAPGEQVVLWGRFMADAESTVPLLEVSD